MTHVHTVIGRRSWPPPDLSERRWPVRWYGAWTFVPIRPGSTMSTVWLASAWVPS